MQQQPQFVPVPQTRWVPDSRAPSCQLCHTGFDFFTRRHHCRYCGRVACDTCSGSRLRYRGDDLRICNECFNNMRLGQPPVGSPTQQPQGYPPQQPGGYPPQQQGGYPPQQQQPYPPQQGYPPQQQGGYPPQQQQPYPPQQGYPPPQQQQQPYPPQQQQQQQQPYGSSNNSAAPQPYMQGMLPPHAELEAGIEAALEQFALENEIKRQYIPALRRLYDYDVCVVCDDSGSMSGPADPEDPGLSRWAELKQSMALLLRATSAMGKAIDVYFINRGVFRNITSYDQLQQAFARPPAGGTNTVRVLRRIWEERQISSDMSRPLMVHVFTDGHPTDDNYNEDINGFARWLRTRPAINQTFFAILLCTDDEEVCNMYRPLEYRVRGQWGWTGSTQGITGVDVTEDYRGELRDIRRLRGSRFPFSMGDYIVKCLVGAIDPAVHAVDLPQGASIYGGGGGGFFSNLFS